jgi:glutamyl-tRNA reductase
MGSLAARRLRLEGCGQLMLANRSHHKARQLVAGLGAGETIDMGDLVEAIRRADIVFTSTGATHFVLTRDNVAAAMAGRAERPLFIVDIAVPRDVEPEVASIANVGLADIDALKGLVEVTLERRRAAIPLVEEIIAEHGERFAQWHQSRVAIPVVTSLVQKAESIRAAEIERLLARCPELSERERMLITGASLTIISKLLHSVVTRLRERATANRAEALSFAEILDDLFDLRGRAEERAAALDDRPHA